MIKESDNTSQDFENFVRHWLKLISKGEWDGAFRLIDLPPTYGEPFNEKIFRREVEVEIYDPESRFAKAHPEGITYSDPDGIEGDGRPTAFELDDGSGYSFEHYLPLCSEWSDISMGWEFIRDGSGNFKTKLDFLHVL